MDKRGNYTGAMLSWSVVTGNIKHFPKKPYVVTPRQMLNIILEDREYY